MTSFWVCRPARAATHVGWSSPTKSRARARQPWMSSANGLTCLASRVARVACCRRPMTSRAVGWRPWEATNVSTRSSLARSITLERCENSSRRSLPTPSTSHFGSADRARCSRHPRPAQVPGQLVGEQAVVQLGHADRGPEQRLGVQGPPLAVDGGLDPVEHDDVGVQLRVTGAGVPVVERGRDHPAHVLADRAGVPGAGREHLRLPVRDHRLQRAPVRRVDPRPGGFVRERPRHRDALRDGEGQVEPGHRLLRPSHPPQVVDEHHPRTGRRSPELLTGDRVLQHPEHPPQLLLADLRARLDARSPCETRQAGAQEPARRGSRRGVVPRQPGRPGGLVGARDRGHQVAVPGPERHAPDRHRHGRTTAPRGHHGRSRRQSHQMRPRPREPPRCQTCGSEVWGLPGTGWRDGAGRAGAGGWAGGEAVAAVTRVGGRGGVGGRGVSRVDEAVARGPSDRLAVWFCRFARMVPRGGR